MKKILLISSVLLVGCSKTVPIKVFEHAQSYCKANGGITHLVVNSANVDDHAVEKVVCKDGAVYTGVGFALKENN